jgi:2-keto-4-pentenoate hydratase
MTPRTLLSHLDSGQLWPAAPSDEPGFDVPTAYQQQLAVRALRLARGEVPRGFKIGFTNRTIWPRYGVFAPIWGTVWNTTLSFCGAQGSVELAGTCQPRLEPEAVFGLKSTPPPGATLAQLFDSLDWVAPGFEIVQSHLRDWKFQAADTVADGGLHARLLVGNKLPVRSVATDALAFDSRLATAGIALTRGDVVVDRGVGSNVLDGPLHALLHFVNELRACPGAPDLKAGDVVTTGTWTDAWPVEPGEMWTARFDAPLSSLEVRFN